MDTLMENPEGQRKDVMNDHQGRAPEEGCGPLGKVVNIQAKTRAMDPSVAAARAIVDRCLNETTEATMRLYSRMCI